DMMEWVLDIRLSDDQHDKWQSAFVTEWQKKDHADMVSAPAGWEEFKRWMERVKKLDPAEQKRERAIMADGIMASLLCSPDADDKLLVEICRSSRQGQVHLGQGLVYLTDGAYDKAIAEYTAAISLEPGSGMPYHGRGMAGYFKRDFKQAQRDL